MSEDGDDAMLIDAFKKLFGFGGGGRNGSGDRAAEVGCDGDGDGPEMISCADAMTRLQEFVDGELHGLTHAQVEAHMEVCTRCYPHLKMEKSFRAKVQAALAQPDVPDSLRNRVMEMLADDPGADA